MTDELGLNLNSGNNFSISVLCCRWRSATNKKMANGVAYGTDSIQVHPTQNVPRDFPKSSYFYAGQTVRSRRGGEVKFTKMSRQYAALHQGEIYCLHQMVSFELCMTNGIFYLV